MAKSDTEIVDELESAIDAYIYEVVDAVVDAENASTRRRHKTRGALKAALLAFLAAAREKGTTT